LKTALIIVVHLMTSLKREFLELLEKDKEFRYTVAGYLGILEVLNRLDKLSEEQVKLREELVKLSEEQMRLRKEQIRFREELVKLREDFNKMYKTFNQRLSRVERTLEKLTVDIEEEARSIIKYELKKLGIDMELTSLTLPELEVNIYGATSDMCIIGEAAIRGGIRVIDDLMSKIEVLKQKYPNLLRKKIVPFIYVALPLPELIEEAKRRDVWLLKATKTYHRPKIVN